MLILVVFAKIRVIVSLKAFLDSGSDPLYSMYVFEFILNSKCRLAPTLIPKIKLRKYLGIWKTNTYLCTCIT